MISFRAFCVLFLAVTCVAARKSSSSPTPPKWPASYYIQGRFSLPTADLVQPVEVWTDSVNKNQVVSYFGGQDVYYILLGKSLGAEVVPRVDKKICMSTNDTTGQSLQPFLPDMSSGWTYSGEGTVRGATVDLFVHKVVNYTFTNTYTMALLKGTARPIQLVMYGINTIGGSHPDHYVMDYEVFTPTIADPSSVFALPALCKSVYENVNVADAEAVRVARQKARRVAFRIGAQVQQSFGRLVPANQQQCEASAEFVAWSNRHGRHYRHCAEHAARERVWQSHQRVVAEHNAAAARGEHTYTLRADHWTADLTQEEYRAVYLLPRSAATAEARAASAARATRAHHVPRGGVKGLPSNVNWREAGAVGHTLDQASCGSCWAFGSMESLGAMDYISKSGAGTRELQYLSPQQLVDCAWVTSTDPYAEQEMGCDGGFASLAYEYLMKQHGTAQTKTYPYIGMDGFCNQYDNSSGVVVTGYVNVTSETQLMHALATVGPVAIAIDASLSTFRFYADGVYSDPACKNDVNSLDHEVLAYGYGTTDLGQQYWMVLNSWSNVWGRGGGDVLISRNGNLCGVATQATYPIVS